MSGSSAISRKPALATQRARVLPERRTRVTAPAKAIPSSSTSSITATSEAAEMSRR